MAFGRSQLAVSIIGTIVAIFGVAYTVASKDRSQPPINSAKDRFYCFLNPDTNNGGEVWTVMYRKNKNKSQPWLRMVTTLGENWTPEERCQEIADRLEMYREDGLEAFHYRESHPNTPNQGYMCALTKISREDCRMVITYKPNIDVYETYRDMTKALQEGRGIFQNSNGVKSSELSPESSIIYLNNFLVEEDR